MQPFPFAIAVVSALIFVLGLMSRPMANRFFASPPMLALVLGILFGPALAGTVDAGRLSQASLEELTRVTLAVGVMGIALQVPYDHLRRAIGPLRILLLGVMSLSALVTAALFAWLLPLPFTVAAVVGAILCPTDPIVAAAITSSRIARRCVPDPVRHIIEVESGANDGLAYPLVMLPILVLLEPWRAAEHAFLVQVLLYEVVVGGLFGAVVGVVVGWSITWAEKRALVSRDAFAAYPVALAVAILYFAHLLGLNGFFAVFCAGVCLVVTTRDRSLETEVRARHDISRFFELPLFFILGLLLPWSAWEAMGWRALVLVIGVLLLRRIPAMLVLGRFIGPLHGLPERLFAGWFGPVGISSFFYAVLALRLTGLRVIWDCSTLVIAGSVVVNGITSTWLTQSYARSRPSGTCSEEGEPGGPPPDGDGARADRTPR